MNSLIVLMSLMVVFVHAQRPSYAGSNPVGYPGLASRFRGTEPSTISPFDLNNRLGEEGSSTSKIPVDARGDAALVNRVNQWPRENRPFWVLNAEHIEAQRNPQRNNPTNTQQPARQEVSDPNIGFRWSQPEMPPNRPARTNMAFL